MNNYSISKISRIVIHKVGNKSKEEGIFVSKKETHLSNSLNDVLISYFSSPFKSNEYYNLFHSTDIQLNEVFVYVREIFANPSSIRLQSINLAKHLYNHSTHPNVRGGEFYVVFFKNCVFEGEDVSAIGLFKSEKKDTFLKINPVDEVNELESDIGINVSKLDKGCLIFNTSREDGYVVTIVDNAAKGEEAKYWVDSFLQAKPRHDDYHETQNALTLCKKFIGEQLPIENDVSKADQANLLNRSLDFFKNRDSFNLEEFANEIIEEPEIIKQFQSYSSQYQKESDFSLSESFTISDLAVKKQARIFKAVLKLDKNFHVYIHGDRSLIENGIEKDGRKYYKIYYKNEN